MHIWRCLDCGQIEHAVTNPIECVWCRGWMEDGGELIVGKRRAWASKLRYPAVKPGRCVVTNARVVDSDVLKGMRHVTSVAMPTIAGGTAILFMPQIPPLESLLENS